MDSEKRKALKDAYKNRQITGGICRIICSGDNSSWIQSTNDIESFRNRFNFAMATKSCPDPSMHDKWLKYGSESFSFTVLEQLKKGEDQTDKEFSDDISVLLEIWLEKSAQ